MAVVVKSIIERESEVNYREIFRGARSRIDQDIQTIRQTVAAGDTELRATSEDGEYYVEMMLDDGAVSLEVSPMANEQNETATWIITETEGVYRLDEDSATRERALRELTDDNLEDCNDMSRVERSVRACRAGIATSTNDW